MKWNSKGDPDDAEAIEAMAAAWMAQRDDGLSSEKEEEFQKWRSADPRHEEAVGRLDAAWTLLLGLQRFRPKARAHPDANMLAPPVSRPSFAPLLPLAAAAAALIVAGAAWWHVRARGGAEQLFATSTGGYQRVTLVDGSVAELNSDTEVRVRYTPGERLINLTRGEAHFTVAKNHERPFLVQAGWVKVRAVGTAFDVRIADREVDVLVTEGKVTLTGESAAVPPSLEAGQRAVIALAEAQPAVEKITPAAIREDLAWEGERLVFVETPLAEAVGQFNRHNSMQIELADSSLGALPISGSFRPENVEAFVNLLAQGGHLEVDRPSGDRIVLRQAR